MVGLRLWPDHLGSHLGLCLMVATCDLGQVKLPICWFPLLQKGDKNSPDLLVLRALNRLVHLKGKDSAWHRGSTDKWEGLSRFHQAAACRVPGMSTGQPCRGRRGRGNTFMKSILLSRMVALPRPLNLPGVPLAIVHSAPLAHQDQAGRVTRARRARALLTWSVSDT